MEVLRVDPRQLGLFLLKSNDAGYAGGDEKTWIREDDGSLTIVFEDGEWKSHDNFFGGEPYGGRTIVFHHGRPVWLLVYYGWVAEESQPDRLYAVLRNALKEMPEAAPYRGPERYEEGQFTYINRWEGELGRFTGREEIHETSTLAYQAEYAGGWVDKRQGV